MWEIEVTDEFTTWYAGLPTREADAVTGAVDMLAERGPSLRRPLIGHISRSRHAHMREIIVPYGNLRILFCFDPRRMAILLLGGDKTGRWDAWYDEHVPRADALYDAYLAQLQQEGML